MSMILATLLAVATPFPVCPAPPARRQTCVVDGDTFWLGREKIRIENIDAPDKPGEGRCTPRKLRELAGGRNRPWCDAALYLRATLALSALLSSGRIEIDRRGVDRNGRTLARVRVGGRDVGRGMIGLGFAKEWAR